MRPQVNLLPKYERYNNVPFILFVIGTVVCFLLAGFLIYFYVSTKAELTDVEANVSQLTEEKTLLEARINAADTNDSGTLTEAVAYAEKYVVPTSKLIEEFMLLLPENSYLSKLNYEYESVQIETQFETMTDSAHYVEALTNSPYMKNVVIDQVETFEFDTEEAEGDGKSQYDIMPRYHAYYSLEINKDELVKVEDTDE